MKYQVVILAGGESSRFYPFSRLHKSFFEIAGKTILERTIENVLTVNPSKVIVVLGNKNFIEEKSILEELAIFKDVHIVRQEKPNGMADAILSAEKYIESDFFVINPQHVDFSNQVEPFYNRLHEDSYQAVVGSAETSEPEKYGIIEYEGKEIVGITEKPDKRSAPSNKRVVGTYLFSRDFIKTLQETPNSQYSLESALTNIAKEKKLADVHAPSDTPSLKYPWDVLTLKDKILKNQENNISKNAVLSKTVILKGHGIHIEDGANVCDYAIIEGPAFIGKNALVGVYCQVRGGSIVESEAQIERYTDVKNSIIGKGTHIHSGFIGDSVIGQNVRIGADFLTANKRLDRQTVRVEVKDEKVDSAKTGFGAIIGNSCRIAIRVSSMPGTVIGTGCSVYPQVILKGTYSDNQIVKR